VCAGEIAANSRQEAVRRFSRDDSLRVAVLSIKAAGSNFPHRKNPTTI
jgi:SNF2 family DNA or RNA helicase